MFAFTPARDEQLAAQKLEQLIPAEINPDHFNTSIRRLQSLHTSYLCGCPAPWATAHLQITPELIRQSEVWLPLNMIKPHFERFYRHALTYPPLLGSTPFANLSSWYALVSSYPDWLARLCNPARLLSTLLQSHDLRTKFLLWSFMPRRFYGGAGSDRYPLQSQMVRHWLVKQRDNGRLLRCLDAACGDGAATYALAQSCCDCTYPLERVPIEGWTLDPLECWAAAYATFPHDMAYQADYRDKTAALFKDGIQQSMLFKAVDLMQLKPPEGEQQLFDLIICNGLLGGPIVNTAADIHTIVAALAFRLLPDGLLLVADHFHGGWKKQVSDTMLGEIFRVCGLDVFPAGEGLGALH